MSWADVIETAWWGLLVLSVMVIVGAIVEDWT